MERSTSEDRCSNGVDVVGSPTLANVCATTRYGDLVTACGLAGGMALPASVAPLILRGVTLAGIDSVMAPRDLRLQAWQRLSANLDLTKLGQIAEEIGLNDAVETATKLLIGQVRGRVIVEVNVRSDREPDLLCPPCAGPLSACQCG